MRCASTCVRGALCNFASSVGWLVGCCSAERFDERLQLFLGATLEPNATLRSSAEMLMRHPFLDGVRGRSNQSEWLVANPTPLTRLCGALHGDMRRLLEDKHTNNSFEDMYVWRWQLVVQRQLLYVVPLCPS